MALTLRATHREGELGAAPARSLENGYLRGCRQGRITWLPPQHPMSAPQGHTNTESQSSSPPITPTLNQDQVKSLTCQLQYLSNWPIHWAPSQWSFYKAHLTMGIPSKLLRDFLESSKHNTTPLPPQHRLCDLALPYLSIPMILKGFKAYHPKTCNSSIRIILHWR